MVGNDEQDGDRPQPLDVAAEWLLGGDAERPASGGRGLSALFRQHVAPPLIAQDWAPDVVTAASSLPKTCFDYHASFVAGWIEPVGSEPGGASVARERANDSGREAIVADRTSRGRFLGQVLDDDGSYP